MPARNQGGFALPFTLFVVAIVTIMLSTAFIRVRNDYRISDSSGDMVDALAVAQSGLNAYLALDSFDYCNRAIRPPDGDSVRIDVQDGYAIVVANVVTKPADTLTPWTYIVRSTGHLIRPSRGAEPQAERTVAQFAQWQRNSIRVLAAFTAANGFTNIHSSTGQLKGLDQARSGCQEPTVNGLRVPAGDRPTDGALSGSYKGDDDAGSPPIPTIYDQGSHQSVADSTGIDWLATITGGIVPDYESVRFGDLNWPVMLVPGDVSVDFGNPGIKLESTGLLIVTGNLEITGGSWLQWNGVVLAGGEIEFRADDQRFDGLVISGLGYQNGTISEEGHVHGGNVDIDYNSDFVRRALASLAGWAAVGNAWVDNWTTY